MKFIEAQDISRGDLGSNRAGPGATWRYFSLGSHFSSQFDIEEIIDGEECLR
jgi:hypothetical protein